ncbi:MAG: hypothetical protein Q8R08_03370 [bacterium]|nr:hypothetical protein [bacterium]
MSDSNIILIFCGGLIAALILISLAKRELSDDLKLFLFTGIVAATSIATIFLTVDTMAKNQSSITGGPVHWHADFRIFVCGEEIDLKNPSGISNRIGTTDFHEHGDNRIHMEGVVQKYEDITLSRFFEVIGGELKPSYAKIPSTKGDLLVQNGMNCGQDESSWQVFLYKTRDKKIVQEKLQNYTEHVMSPHSLIPPGDCLIMEFGAESKASTENICDFYQIAIDKGEYNYPK